MAQDADVVNLSLGGPVTDGIDPMARPSTGSRPERTSALRGRGRQRAGPRATVSSPGCVEGVLTWARSTTSGRPLGSPAAVRCSARADLKPDIAAPGVAIVGAQADSPGGIHYIAMSGTSMATPHVVGAAALVRQAHPDWTAQQVKAALTASVKGSPEGTVYDQGSGELWTPDAIDATVTSDVSVEVAARLAARPRRARQRDGAPTPTTRGATCA